MIDTTQWRYFKFGTLLDDIYKAKAHAKIDETVETDIDENSVLFITRSESDNGCDGYINQIDLDGIEDGNAIIIGDTTSTCFYQNRRFAAGDHIVVCRASWMNKYTALFVKTILEKERYRYSYGRAFKIELIKNTDLLLPVDSYGNPDWAYMEKYISVIYKKYSPTTRNKVSQKKNSINTDNWKYFNITKLFSKLVRGKISDTDLLEEGNDCLYVGAKRENNGVIKRCLYDEKLISRGNCVVFICDGQGSVGYANYMDRDFMATINLTLGYNPELNKARGIFIATVASLERPRYSYGRKWHAHLADTRIKLPATPEGEPDWNYMENYIKSLPYGDCI